MAGLKVFNINEIIVGEAADIIKLGTIHEHQISAFLLKYELLEDLNVQILLNIDRNIVKQLHIN